MRLFLWFRVSFCLYLAFEIGFLKAAKLHKIISDIVPDCYVIHIRSNDLDLDPIYRSLAVPSVNIELRTLDFSILDVLGIHQIIQNQEQCVTFLVSIESLRTEADELRFLQIFGRNELQPQAVHSFLIFYQSGEELIKEKISPAILGLTLENFPNRILLLKDAVTRNFNLFRFCYYCFDDKPGFMPSGISFGSTQMSSLSHIFPEPMRNLDGHTLRFTAPPAPPLVFLVPSKTNPGTLEIVGMQEVILKSMAKVLNFTFTLKKASGGLTGVRFPNGSWNGIMEEVLTGKADIGLSVATTYDRNKLFDFTIPVFNAFLVLVSTKPTPFFDWEAIFFPFRRNAWFAILASTFLSLLTYCFLHNASIEIKDKGSSQRKTEPMKENSEQPIIPKPVELNGWKKKMTLFKATYLTVGALLEQGAPVTNSTLPSRLFIAFWLLISIVITCAYRSKLFLFLTFPLIEKPPSTFQELANSDYKSGLKSLGGVGLLFITKSPLPDIRQLGGKLEISYDTYSCLDRTVTEKFVCVIYRAYIDYMLELRYWNMRHKFFISDFLTPPVGSSWVLRKHSPLLPILDKFHISQFEMGLADKYIDHYQQGVAKKFRIEARKPNAKVDKFDINLKYVEDEDGASPLQLENLYGSFFILLFGLSLGFLSLIIEKLKNRFEKSENDTRSYASISIRDEPSGWIPFGQLGYTKFNTRLRLKARSRLQSSVL